MSTLHQPLTTLSVGQQDGDTQWPVHGFTDTESDLNTATRGTNHLKDHEGGGTGQQPTAGTNCADYLQKLQRKENL